MSRQSKPGLPIHEGLERSPRLKSAVENCMVTCVKMDDDEACYELGTPIFTDRKDGQVYYSLSDDSIDDDDENTVPSSELVSSETFPGEFDVEKICGKMIFNGSVRYKIKWRNFAEIYNTYESISNLSNSLLVIQDYEVRNPNQKLDVEISVNELRRKMSRPPSRCIKDLLCFNRKNNSFIVLW